MHELISVLIICFVAFGASLVADHRDPVSDLEKKWGFDWGYSGIVTFGHLPSARCLTEIDERFDIAIIGAPFDTAVSYRPGARFGPRAIRSASSRHLPSRSFDIHAGINPYISWARILDCGDIPITPFDNDLALRQMSNALYELGSRAPARCDEGKLNDTCQGPKLLILGGDHSIALPSLRALNRIHGHPIAVVHFDAHLDTLHPRSYPSEWNSEQTEFTHGSMFWKASNEGLILSGSSVHVGLRTRLTGTGWDDYKQDDDQGYLRTEDIDDVGVDSIVRVIMDRVGTRVPVYLSIDIDVLDPGIAPGTGAPEAGGWTMREMQRALRGLRKLNVVGADIVEVAPAYDDRSESTAFAAAQLAFEILSNLVKRGLSDSNSLDIMNAVDIAKTEL